MKKLLFLAALLFAPPVYAQSVSPGIGAASCGTELRPGFNQCSGENGPGDIVPGAIGWWGFRTYTSNYTGNIADICDVATGLVCATITAVNGVLSFPLISALSCNGGIACNISKLYDQSGALRCASAVCDLVQATNSKRPTLSFSCSGITAGRPCAVFLRASAQVLISAANHAAQIQPFTISAVASRTGSTTLLQALCCGTDIFVGYNNAVNVAVLSAGTALTAAASDNAFHAVQYVINGLSSDLNVDAVSAAGAGGATTFSASVPFNVGGQATSTNNFSGNISEIGVWAVAFSGANSTNMSNNQRAYWGF